MYKLYTFTAAIKRNDEPTIHQHNCATIDGYLCQYNGRPIWNSRSLQAAGIELQSVSNVTSIDQAVASGLESHLFKFGKQEGYWVWNHDAAEKKKVENARTVYYYIARTDQYDDEGEERVKQLPYPKEVVEIIDACVHKSKYTWAITRIDLLSKKLEAIGWKLETC